MEGPTPEELAHELTRLHQSVSRLEIEQAQQSEQYARRDIVDERLKATAALTAEKLAGINAWLKAQDKAIEQVQTDAREREKRQDAKDTARRNIVYGGMVAALCGLAAAAIQVGVLG